MKLENAGSVPTRSQHGADPFSTDPNEKEPMTNVQLYLSIGIPMLFNALLIGLLQSNMKSKSDDLEKRLADKFASINQRFDAINQRFDDMKELWRAEMKSR